MQVTAKNWGYNTEVTDVQMNIVRFEGTDDFFIDENFSGTFPPDGWTTDWWNQSNTNYASALAPEAHCYYYDQIVYYDYYDNYVQGPIVNATGWEKVNLRFAFSADVQSNCYLYLRYRKNSTSPWLDITPWDVPIASDFTDWFEIGFYSIGEDIGNEFQFKFEYLGYYSYFRNWYLDNVTLEGYDGCDEYSEIVEDVTIPVGEPVDVDFPAWTPTNWQNESTVNMWFDYHVQARTLLDDQVKKNDQKWKLVDIYFPWMDDVAAINLEGPESGPAQTFDVVGTIKNVGQNEQCCFKTYVTISEIDYTNTSVLWIEDFELGSGNTPPPGWDTGNSSP
ncbi:hypothetical protein MBGDF03_01062 [Thermoplasmatales archaeon SCGC AB-540-F20]|nr:hypothetical protein MBGDF03_01062 [Thermoplasmatales archaeon SCGC AB-540-F20]